SIMDARKNELFAAFFISTEGCADNRISEDLLISPHDLTKMIHEKTVLIGNGALVYEDFLRSVLGERVLFSPSHFNFPKASNCAILGAKRLKDGNRDDLSALAPQYLRRADAEILKER
ncbi:MAG: tRNA threonylcarbamoyladenosine biosynthesis protein TsaB, partial [Thermodesulfobacteriota bacterium]